jgi:hypothetical protein
MLLAASASAASASKEPEPTAPTPQISISCSFKQIVCTTALNRHAVYTVACVEGRSSYRVDVRWSDLARLIGEMMHSHGDAMRAGRKRGEIPPFHAHSMRIGGSKFSKSFITSRAASIQTLLFALCRTLDVSLVEQRGPMALRVFLTRGCDVEFPTPEERWFAPEHGGWPRCVLNDVDSQHLAPRTLTPTSVQAPALHPPTASTQGELRVEVLEATGLRRSDRFSQNDVYAVLVLDGHALQTQTLDNMAHPRWLPEDGRAARLPFCSPYSTLYVGLFDADYSTIDEDDPLGRVALPLRNMHPGLIYTCWLPLQYDEDEEAAGSNGRRGCVRLRYSIRLRSVAQYAFIYLAPPMPSLRLPVAKEPDKKVIRFALGGRPTDRRYSRAALESHVGEFASLLGHAETLQRTMADVFYWRHPRLSAGAFVLWQAACFQPVFLISFFPLTTFVVLLYAPPSASASASPPLSRIQCPPTVRQRILALLGCDSLAPIPTEISPYTPTRRAPREGCRRQQPRAIAGVA